MHVKSGNFNNDENNFLRTPQFLIFLRIKTAFIPQIMRRIILVLFLISACFTNIQAQQITLEDLFIKRSFKELTVTGLASTKDGMSYTTI